MIALNITVFLIMLLASVQDFKNAKVAPALQIALLCCSLLKLILLTTEKDYCGLLNNISAGMLVFIIYVIQILLSHGKGIGGADFKISVLLAFFLGLMSYFILTIIEALAIFGFCCFCKAKKIKIDSVRLMPFLFVGLLPALFVL